MDNGISSIQIFRNYNSYITSHKDKFNDSHYFLEVLSDDSKYNAFISTLSQGMNESQISVSRMVCDSQREFLLQETSNIMNTDIAIGYAISYFPILCDTYCTDILGQAVLYKDVKQPTFTIPKMKMVASVNNSDGSTDSWVFPRALFMMRSKLEHITLLPNKTNYLFKSSACYPDSVNQDISKINKRYFTIQTLKIEIEKVADNSKVVVDHPIMQRPDAREQINSEFDISVDDKLIKCTLIGHIKYDSGQVAINLTTNAKSSEYNIKLLSADSTCMFTSKTSDIGRVKISVKMSGTDINIDVNEDFEYDLDVETIQEYTDIYNINLIQTLSTAIKGQILLNRDHDVAHLLELAESEMKLNHTYENLEFKPIFDTEGFLSPGYYQSIYQNIVPKFALISRYMYYNTNLIPTYLLCGIKTSAMLESLQEFSISLPQMRSGVGGFNNSYGHQTVEKSSFRYYNILMSHAITDDKVYILYKPSTIEEEHYANLVNFIYKPLYLVEEITNSQKRVFIRSRNTIELLNTNTVGCLHLQDINAAMTTYDYTPRKLNFN